MSSGPKAIVIGAGLGGLAAALRLALAGWRVTVFERGPRPGGKMNVFEQDGYRFDTGPSLITMPWIFERLFTVADNKLSDHLTLKRLDPLTEYYWRDGARLTYTSHWPELIEGIRELDPRDVGGFQRFMKLGARLFDLSEATFFERTPSELPSAKAFKRMLRMPLLRGWGNYAKTVDSFFYSPHLRQLFKRYPTYVGSSPYKAPATLFVIPFIEWIYGGWYVEGGLYCIVEALVALCREHGVELCLNSPVSAIEHGDFKVSGVRLEDGTRLEADAVVFGGDAALAHGMLRGGASTPLSEHERSMSGYVQLMGSRISSDGLAHHTVLFSQDYRREFSELFDRRHFPSQPTVYVNLPSFSDPSLAPEGSHTAFVMANAPANDDAWSETEADEARQRVESVLREHQMGSLISQREVYEEWRPLRIGSSYAMPGGSIYGLVSHGWRRTFLRPPNRARKPKGLYFVGGSTHPGGGTPTVLLSAEITTRLMARDYRIRQSIKATGAGTHG